MSAEEVTTPPGTSGTVGPAGRPAPEDSQRTEPPVAPHEEIYAEAMARLEAISRQWRQTVGEVTGPGHDE